VNPELGARIAADRKPGDGDQLPASEVECIATVDVAERELDHHAREVGRNFRDAALHEMGQLVRGKLLGNVEAAAITITH